MITFFREHYDFETFGHNFKMIFFLETTSFWDKKLGTFKSGLYFFCTGPPFRKAIPDYNSGTSTLSSYFYFTYFLYFCCFLKCLLKALEHAFHMICVPLHCRQRGQVVTSAVVVIDRFNSKSIRGILLRPWFAQFFLLGGLSKQF